MPLSVDYRPMYKLGLIAVILKKVCIGNKSSLNKLHFFVWALKSKKNMDFIKSVLDAGNENSILSWGVEPALNKALSLGVAEGLFLFEDTKYILTKAGEELTKKIEIDSDLLVEEKEFLNSIGKRKASEAFIHQLTLKLSN